MDIPPRGYKSAFGIGGGGGTRSGSFRRFVAMEGFVGFTGLVGTDVFLFVGP